MQFNSFAFVLFFAVVFPLYCALNFRWQNRLLLAASYLFYGWVEPRFLGMMFLTTVIDFYIGMRIGDAVEDRTRRKWMLASVAMNLIVLGFFKYYDFFLLSAQDALHSFGFRADAYLLKLALPAGISFYTFHEISYTVDVYRKHIKPARKFEDFAVFISFFPQLVAGPIGRASWQMPQFEKPRRMTWQGWCDGALLILIGFFKKMAVADVFAVLTEKAFRNPGACSGGTLMLGLYCFAIQIYADFSGYTDIARGLAKLMGFDLIENFNQPYFASNITEFWRRWHISLSTWLRDYLYIPLGGNRRGKARTYLNLFLTMFLGGLWHGASWKFAVWGALHGGYLAAHKLILGERGSLRVGGASPLTPAFSPKKGEGEQPVLRLFKIFFTFHLVCLAWIFFRADTLGGAFEFLTGIVMRFGTALPSGVSYGKEELIPAWTAALVLIFLIDLPQFLKRDHCTALSWRLPARAGFYALLFVWIIMMRGIENVPFIYFQF